MWGVQTQFGKGNKGWGGGKGGKGSWAPGGFGGGYGGGFNGGGFGGGFDGGKGWGMMKGKGKGKGKRTGPSGPLLERTRMSEAPVTGEVAEWKGKYGWITPTVPIEHPLFEKHKGKLYVSISDLAGGLTQLTAGNLCQFHVFSDASGLGAEEVIGS
ncbi:unnamed protein product [Polarella glacialis]|uniref:Uncharacterized protein n=1 Tax=Polarella glacialis TaxID=89957 RepID=A0A813F355_POLGL|nr:unnamed protein product [Polarella glacialis]|mmetsp:Transcript_43455/g.70418  ORF Transcript_43455/g.70418 Transcript_43455/m.70418 type:complete len:156 (-) Transcript_43455:119-586(-)|eukprot:CAMPEP_0115088066 /NCGR_PEP_ID=MMETSP0227-20121206/23747_1 /TAXON_ID=89957 /ORGANISM="Polarella glacialis, Strain CCMP 1383" /LENGTH=155 /DNA_ID=CAMNT_0002478219 /DNA_START=96 /DNA_END=563 /DNA_ORIENTATION=-